MPARREIRNLSLLDLMRYRLPVPGVLSILHRASGALLFVALPGVLWLFELSLRSETSFEHARAVCSSWYVRIVLAALAWSLIHHVVAGIRYLALDLDLGMERSAARRSAWIVFAVSVPLAAWAALKIFGVA